MNDLSPQSALITPKSRRQEILDIKNKLADYAQFKNEHKEIVRRDRIFKTAWRHGILGIDNADSAQSSVFYKDDKAKKAFYQNEKDVVNTKRKDCK